MEALPNEIWYEILGHVGSGTLLMCQLANWFLHNMSVDYVCSRTGDRFGIADYLVSFIVEGDARMAEFLLATFPVPVHIPMPKRSRITDAVAEYGNVAVLQALNNFPLLTNRLVQQAAVHGNYDVFIRFVERVDDIEVLQHTWRCSKIGGNPGIIGYLRNTRAEWCDSGSDEDSDAQQMTDSDSDD